MPSHSNLQIFQLGTKERNDICVHRTMQYLLMTPFVDVKEWREYQEQVTQINLVISDTRNLLNAGIITDKAYKSRVTCKILVSIGSTIRGAMGDGNGTL